MSEAIGLFPNWASFAAFFDRVSMGLRSANGDQDLRVLWGGPSAQCRLLKPKAAGSKSRTNPSALPKLSRKRQRPKLPALISRLSKWHWALGLRRPLRPRLQEAVAQVIL
jgi:hypothetical protein